MQQIKIFKQDEDEIHLLERKINEWLRQSKAKVVNIFGNIAPQTTTHVTEDTAIGVAFSNPSDQIVASDVLLVVVYEDKQGKVADAA